MYSNTTLDSATVQYVLSHPAMYILYLIILIALIQGIWELIKHGIAYFFTTKLGERATISLIKFLTKK